MAPRSSLALGPDPAAVPADDPLHGGKADAGAFELRVFMQPLKRVEQPGRVRHVESRAIVAQEVDPGHPAIGRAEFNACRRVLARELPGVLQQVHHRRAQQDPDRPTPARRPQS